MRRFERGEPVLTIGGRIVSIIEPPNTATLQTYYVVICMETGATERLKAWQLMPLDPSAFR